ncbi:MAG: TadE/TadG family type IV pilus assembly protein [Pelagimonas sp.]|uniref:TadE/TadG family type IV pilus assembly protein n=1 Tax=Pelagimonas sp. TaxID=2073170 RepID=UPI003D6A7A39
MFDFMKSRFRRFADDTQGYITVEAMIVLPVLLWLFGASWVYFDAFRQQSISQKANYVIGDMFSRETDPINGTYVDNARELLRELTKSSDSESDLRVTVVQYDTNIAGWQVVWSQERGDQTALNNGGLSAYSGKLPVASGGDQLILVETWDLHEPIFDVGLSDFEIHTYSFTRPRYAPQVVYSNS